MKFKSKKGMINYMYECYCYDNNISSTEEEKKTFVNMIIEALNTFKENNLKWEQVLASLKLWFKNVFIGFQMQDNIIALWNFEL